MCIFFSVRSDGAGKVYYFNNEQRKEVRSVGENPDSHTFIAHYNEFVGEDEDMLNAYEYDFLTRELTVDKMPNKNDMEAVKKFCDNLSYKEVDDTVKKCRIKTEDEFIKEFGDQFRFDIDKTWCSPKMDMLFGKKVLISDERNVPIADGWSATISDDMIAEYCD